MNSTILSNFLDIAPNNTPHVCNACEQKNKCRKIKYKKRKENEKQRIRRKTAIRKGRTYEDFKEYIGKHPECSIVEMDTVEGAKGGKVFLTLIFRQSRFMLIYLMVQSFLILYLLK